MYEVRFLFNATAYIAMTSGSKYPLATYGADEAWITLEWHRGCPLVLNEQGSWVKSTEHLSFYAWARKHVPDNKVQIRGSIVEGALKKSLVKSQLHI